MLAAASPSHGGNVGAGVTSPCVGPIAKTDFEATLRAAAPG
jgi:hypothetical protein